MKMAVQHGFLSVFSVVEKIMSYSKSNYFPPNIITRVFEGVCVSDYKGSLWAEGNLWSVALWPTGKQSQRTKDHAGKKLQGKMVQSFSAIVYSPIHLASFP